MFVVDRDGMHEGSPGLGRLGSTRVSSATWTVAPLAPAKQKRSDPDVGSERESQ